MKQPQSHQNREELRGLAELPTELLGPGVGAFHLGGGKALGHHERHAESDLQRELLLDALGSVGQSLEQLEGSGQMGDRLCIRRMLHRLLASELEVLYRLWRV